MAYLAYTVTIILVSALAFLLRRVQTITVSRNLSGGLAADNMPKKTSGATTAESELDGPAALYKASHSGKRLHPSRQKYDAFLVLDFEGTCELGTGFDYPNEIIEFPIYLMRWMDETPESRESLEVVDVFHSFSRPVWRRELSEFCTTLTGITQAQVDAAPEFPSVLDSVSEFLVRNGLIDGETGRRLVRYCWCSDGPWDFQNFLVKQCFISNISIPEYMKGDVLDVRSAVVAYNKTLSRHNRWTRQPMNIDAQLTVLRLPGFVGRRHSGLDDARNITRVLTELAKKGVLLHPNTRIYSDRRWNWMGRNGKIIEDLVPPAQPMTFAQLLES